MAINEIPKLIKKINQVAEVVSYTAPARATEKVTDSLQQLGPRWTGFFSNSWFVESKGYGIIADGSRQEGNPVPIRFSGLPPRSGVKRVLASGVSKFFIGNNAYYAEEAIDAVPYTPEPFDQPEPLKKAKSGLRKPGGTRGMKNLDINGPNRQTAQLDWFPKYAAGGNMQKEIESTFKSVFEKIK
tara:strand:- start:411 stop:965 length:555 start_codon:yes stop_codon:yes gene_type:complete